MSGFGERFRRAGYKVPKPLIEVDGKPLIAHTIDLFPGETDILFICSQEHLDDAKFYMQDLLSAYCPTGRVESIQPHKLGPVHAVLEAANAIARDTPTLVTYCDFACFWDYLDFRKFVTETNCDGAVVCYRGFHPHMLRNTNYGYVEETGGVISDYREKQSFTDDPMSEFASAGMYYFSSGRLMLDACEAAKEQGLSTNGEYYVSLTFKPLLDAGRNIIVYEVPHFMQWGTPEDLANYQKWSELFGSLTRPIHSPRQSGTLLIPAAGLGSRFVAEGYATPKPLIGVSGKPMLLQSLRDLPVAEKTRVVLRGDQTQYGDVVSALKDHDPNIDIVTLDNVTEGQAQTCLNALDGIVFSKPLTIGACDNGVIYDVEEFQSLMDDEAIDVIVWGVRGHPEASKQPKMFGWIDCKDDGQIRHVSVKHPLSNPNRDPIVLGTFTFKRARDFLTSANHMIEREGRVNGEFYVDECINDALALGLNCHLLEVNHYLGWGTPNDLKTFTYWQSCFHKWKAHPYRLQLDDHVHPDDLIALNKRYAWQPPARPRGQGYLRNG